MSDPDYLIVGGGSAGATLASRLSEDPATRVLLIEAGIDTPPDAVPADIADTFPSSSLNKDYFWPGLECTRVGRRRAAAVPAGAHHGRRLERDGLVGAARDAERLRCVGAAGADGWGMERCGPHAIAGWRAIWIATTARSQPGPYVIRPHAGRGVARASCSRSSAQPRRAAFARSPTSTRIRATASLRCRSARMRRRASSARCYLTERGAAASQSRHHAADARDGAALRGCHASLASRPSAVGEIQELSAREVILSAGAIHSPAMLLRAGIGPAEELQRLGITPRVGSAWRRAQSPEPSLSAFCADAAAAIAAEAAPAPFRHRCDAAFVRSRGLPAAAICWSSRWGGSVRVRSAPTSRWSALHSIPRIRAAP